MTHTVKDIVASSDTWHRDEYGVAMRVCETEDASGMTCWTEIRLEPLLFGRTHLAVYDARGVGDMVDYELIGEKLPIRLDHEPS